jgi:short chain dehydrogenase
MSADPREAWPMQASDKLPTYPDLAGKVAVVTGGSGGIGSATCRLLAASGARVAVNGRDQARLDTVVEAIHAAGGTAIGVAADCTDLAAVERLRQQVEQDLGPAEVLAAFVGGPGTAGAGRRRPRAPLALHRGRQLDRDLPDPQELPARHDRARSGRDRDHGPQRGPAPGAGRTGAVHGRQGGCDDAHPPGRQRAGPYGVRANCQPGRRLVPGRRPAAGSVRSCLGVSE